MIRRPNTALDLTPLRGPDVAPILKPRNSPCVISIY
jgi:hypothetical protein